MLDSLQRRPGVTKNLRFPGVIYCVAKPRSGRYVGEQLTFLVSALLALIAVKDAAHLHLQHDMRGLRVPLVGEHPEQRHTKYTSSEMIPEHVNAHCMGARPSAALMGVPSGNCAISWRGKMCETNPSFQVSLPYHQHM